MNSLPVERTLLVYLRDRERDIGTGFKTRGRVADGRLGDAPWRTGEYACDCVRGAILYGGGEFACGRSRFQVERVFDWDTGEELRVAPGAEDARRLPPGHGPREGAGAT